MPEKLERQVDYLKIHPDVALVHTDYITIEESGSEIKSFNSDRRYVVPTGYVYHDLFCNNFIAMLTVLLRRECIEKIGGFNESNESIMSVEDYELWLRISKKHKIGYIGQKLAKYRIHPGCMTQNVIPHLKSRVTLIETVLGEFPETYSELGSERVKYRLHNVYFALAYHLFDQGAYRNGRPHFAQALRFQPRHWPSYGYYLASWLPPAWVNGLRQLKRSLAKETKPLVQNAKNKEYRGLHKS